MLGRREMTQKWGSNWHLADSLRVLIVFSFALYVCASRVLSSCRLVVLRFRCLVLRYRRLLFVIVSSWPGRYLLSGLVRVLSSASSSLFRVFIVVIFVWSRPCCVFAV